MKLCAHTMGTPEHDVYRASELFSELGFDAIEIICHSDYRCSIHPGWSADELTGLHRHLSGLKLKTACITPYLYTINSFDEEERQACIREAKTIVQLAHRLEARGVRILAGTEPKPEDRPRATELLIRSLREIGGFAAPYGVELWVENHMGSLADSAKATGEIVRESGAGNVGIVYDQANLIQLRAEGYEEAIRLQAPYIRHVHVKDKIWAEGARRATLLGEGQTDWPGIVRELKAIGYGGTYCYEYERRWAPEYLPPAEQGMAHGYAYLKKLL